MTDDLIMLLLELSKRKNAFSKIQSKIAHFVILLKSGDSRNKTRPAKVVGVANSKQ